MWLKLVALVSASAMALIAADKPNFSGKWRLQGNDANAASVLVIEQVDRELKITTDGGGEDSIKVECNTVAKECDGTVSGRPAKISYWYNGPTLVEMLLEGKNRATKTRRTLSDDGQTMTVEVTPILPSGKSAIKMVFVRASDVAAKNP